MSRLSAELSALKASGDPVSVAVVGVGRIGRSIAIGSQQVDGVDVTAIADIQLDQATDTFGAMEHTEDVRVVDSAAEGEAALADGARVVTRDALLPPRMEGIDAVIAATGIPQIGAQVATRAIFDGTHVIMLTDETDAVVGPYLSEMAAQAGVVYSGAGGDEPGSIMELYDFADSLGFDVVAAGKGKNNPLDRSATPDSLREEATANDLNPEIYTAFVDGTNSMLEMTMVANATGLGVDTRGMHAPTVHNVASLADVFDSRGDNGVLERDGVVDFALGGGVAPGVFLVVTTDSDTVRADLDYLKMGSGPNYVLHRSYHIPTLEPLLTAARAVVYDDAYLVPQAPVVDTVAVAKRSLEPGDEIDGIGGHTVYGLAENADVVESEDLVPISLVKGATVTAPVETGTPLRSDDIELVDSELLHLRRLQDAYF